MAEGLTQQVEQIVAGATTLISQLPKEQQSTAIVEALKGQIAKDLTRDAEKHNAFEILTNKWHSILSEVQTLIDTDTEKAKELLFHVVGNVATVRNIGLNDLPDAIKAPISGPDSPASLPPTTTEVKADEVHVVDDGNVVIAKEPPGDSLVVDDTTDSIRKENGEKQPENTTSTDLKQEIVAKVEDLKTEVKKL